MIKAAIFMGDPRYQYGLAYNVGTCRAGGVRTSLPYQMTYLLTLEHSSLPVLPASSAPTQARSSPTATPRTPTAATETMPTIISNTSASTARRLCLSSRASSTPAEEVAAAVARPLRVLLSLLPRAEAVVAAAGHVLLSGDNAVALVGVVLHAVHQEHASRRTSGTRSALPRETSELATRLEASCDCALVAVGILDIMKPIKITLTEYAYRAPSVRAPSEVFQALGIASSSLLIDDSLSPAHIMAACVCIRITCYRSKLCAQRRPTIAS
jgi:hypothetical protein